MRNESDIFNLKEPKEGDTNGMQMFSVNGSCQLTKLCRRRNLHHGSSSFEYGSSSGYQQPFDLPEVHRGTGDFNEYTGDNLNDINEELEDLQLGEQQDTARSEEAMYNDPEQMYTERRQSPKKTSVSSNSSPTKKKAPVFHKITAKKDEKVTESAIARNPLTGAGVEIETQRKSKKGPVKSPKWVW